jgi:hypothetical protein
MATGAKFTWVVPPSAVFPKIPEMLAAQQRAAIFLLFQVYSPQIENWLKDNAPWTDQTGNLRQSLWAEARLMSESVVIALDYGLSYGEFLEFSHAGHYAIIAPAVDYWFPQVWDAAVRLLGLKSGGGMVKPTR